jgi:hypothetical protein
MNVAYPWCSPGGRHVCVLRSKPWSRWVRLPQGRCVRKGVCTAKKGAPGYMYQKIQPSRAPCDQINRSGRSRLRSTSPSLPAPPSFSNRSLQESSLPCHKAPSSVGGAWSHFTSHEGKVTASGLPSARETGSTISPSFWEPQFGEISYRWDRQVQRTTRYRCFTRRYDAERPKRWQR